MNGRDRQRQGGRFQLGVSACVQVTGSMAGLIDLLTETARPFAFRFSRHAKQELLHVS
jgi:hypothetical protein